MICIVVCAHEERWIKVEEIYPSVKSDYEISSYGNVRNATTNFVMKHVIEPRGYHCVTLTLKNGSQKRFYIHDLVARGFIEKLDNHTKYEVNHKNGLKRNNFLENLEWITSKQNIRHAIKIGLRSNLYGVKHHKNIYSEDCIKTICSFLEKRYKPAKILKELEYLHNECKTKKSRIRRLIKHIKRKEQWVQISKNYSF